jgi:membrane protein
VLFGVIYYVVPNRKQRFRQVLPGAVLGGVLFEAITLLFPLYLKVNTGINAYGSAFALMFLLMAYFFLMGQIMMLGLELNSVLYPIKVHPSSDRRRAREG